MDKDDRYTRITLRIPRELHSRLTEAADRTSKSLNAEIIGRLESSFSDAATDDKGRVKSALLELVKEYGLSLDKDKNP